MPQAPKSFQQVLQELWELLKAYAKQETVGPLRDLGRQIGLGLGGAFAFSLGYFLIVLGIMRALQFHGPEFFQVHNWTGYFIAVALLAGAILLAVRKVRGKNASVGPDPKKNPPKVQESRLTTEVPAGASAGPAVSTPQEPGR